MINIDIYFEYKRLFDRMVFLLLLVFSVPGFRLL